jgi:hypothetical protein
MATINLTGGALDSLRCAQMDLIRGHMNTLARWIAEVQGNLGDESEVQAERHLEREDMLGYVHTLREDLDALEALFREETC